MNFILRKKIKYWDKYLSIFNLLSEYILSELQYKYKVQL